MFQKTLIRCLLIDFTSTFKNIIPSVFSPKSYISFNSLTKIISSSDASLMDILNLDLATSSSESDRISSTPWFSSWSVSCGAVALILLFIISSSISNNYPFFLIASAWSYILCSVTSTKGPRCNHSLYIFPDTLKRNTILINRIRYTITFHYHNIYFFRPVFPSSNMMTTGSPLLNWGTSAETPVTFT